MIAPEVGELLLHVLEERHETGAEFRQWAMRCLHEMPHIDWAGVYRLEGERLVLDEFAGEPTEHVTIAVGLGVCGTAVQENTNLIVDDVRVVDNYLSCSPKTRSEIVVLIRDSAGVLGQIDLDGHQVSAFDRSDELFLEQVAHLIALRWQG